MNFYASRRRNGRGIGLASGPAFGAAAGRRGERRRAAGRRPSLFRFREPRTRHRSGAALGSLSAPSPRLRHGRRSRDRCRLRRGLGALMRTSGGPESCTHPSAYGGAATERDASVAERQRSVVRRVHRCRSIAGGRPAPANRDGRGRIVLRSRRLSRTAKRSASSPPLNGCSPPRKAWKLPRPANRLLLSGVSGRIEVDQDK